MNEEKAAFIELLKTQHSFPWLFTLKFIGTVANDFPSRVVAAARDALQTDQDPPHTTRPSKDKHLVSVTLMPIVSSPEQIVAIYERVKQVEGLKVSL